MYDGTWKLEGNLAIYENRYFDKRSVYTLESIEKVIQTVKNSRNSFADDYHWRKVIAHYERGRALFPVNRLEESMEELKIKMHEPSFSGDFKAYEKDLNKIRFKRDVIEYSVLAAAITAFAVLMHGVAAGIRYLIGI